MEKAIGGRFAWYQPPEEQPRTKDDDEEDSDMTLNTYETLGRDIKADIDSIGRTILRCYSK
jgi:hypothetical protein